MHAAVALDVSLVTALALPYRLTINNLDLIKAPNGNGSVTYGVDPRTVHVVEAWVTAIPTMDFTIDDPAKAIAIAGGEEVRLHDTVRDEPIFRGFVDAFDEVTWAGQQGRQWVVRCVGFSALLERTKAGTDQTLAPSATFSRGDYIQWLATAMLPQLNNAMDPTTAPTAAQSQGTTALPVGHCEISVNDHRFTTLTGTKGSFRTMIEAMGNASLGGTGGPASNMAIGLFVDFYNGLRTFQVEWDPSGGAGVYVPPQGAAPYNVSDVVGGGVKIVENLTYSVDLSQLVNAVYVDNLPAAGSVWVKDRASIALYGERQDYLANYNTGYDATFMGNSFIARHGPLLRGSYDVSGTGYEGLHAGQSQTITNAALGLSAIGVLIGSVETSFQNGTQRSWHVQFSGSTSTTGGYSASLAPSVARLIRSLVS